MSEKGTSTIHVTLAVYDPKGTYSQHAGVVMASLFENTRSPVCVHLLHDKTLTQENREKLSLTAERYAQNVVFKDMSPYVEKLGPDVLALVNKVFSPGSLYRIFASEILLLDKVIYLDSDIVVNLDIKELWEIPLEGYCLIGVLDNPYFLNAHKKRFSVESIRSRQNGCDPSHYINSGVLVMNLDLIRQNHDLLRESINWFAQHKHTTILPDQDFLNAFFRGRIKLADSRFNRYAFGCVETANAILHAIGSPKPWEAYRGATIEPLYWKALLKTPWSDSCIDSLYAGLARTPLLHHYTAECYKTIFSRLIKDMFHLPISFFLGIKNFFAVLCLWLKTKKR